MIGCAKVPESLPGLQVLSQVKACCHGVCNLDLEKIFYLLPYLASRELTSLHASNTCVICFAICMQHCGHHLSLHPLRHVAGYPLRQHATAVAGNQTQQARSIRQIACWLARAMCMCTTPCDLKLTRCTFAWPHPGSGLHVKQGIDSMQ
jgi:hypothetical protein